MTVKHIAFMKFKDGVSGDRIEEHMNACRALPGRILGMVDVECGANFGERAGTFTHCIVVTLPDREGLAAYLSDPSHVSVAGALGADVSDVLVMDAEMS